MSNITPYNLIVIVAALVLVAIGAVVFLLGDSTKAAGYVAFATPLLIVLTAGINAYQNSQNHHENQEKINAIADATGAHVDGPKA